MSFRSASLGSTAGPRSGRRPRAPERRCVGQVEIAHGIDRHLVEDGGGCNVDPLGHFGVTVAEELDAQQAAGCPVPGVAHPDPVT